MNVRAELERLAEWWELDAKSDREQAATAGGGGSMSRVAAWEVLANVSARHAAQLRDVVARLVTEAAA